MATVRWTGNAGNNHVGNPLNWRREGQCEVPREGDDVVIPSRFGSQCLFGELPHLNSFVVVQRKFVWLPRKKKGKILHR